MNHGERDSESAMMAAEFAGEPSIDLHGLPIHEALETLNVFFHQELLRGTEAIIIIHGGGEQKLMRAVHTWLREPPQKPLIRGFRPSLFPTPQGGVTVVALHQLKQTIKIYE